MTKRSDFSIDRLIHEDQSPCKRRRREGLERYSGIYQATGWIDQTTIESSSNLFSSAMPSPIIAKQVEKQNCQLSNIFRTINHCAQYTYAQLVRRCKSGDHKEYFLKFYVESM